MKEKPDLVLIEIGFGLKDRTGDKAPNWRGGIWLNYKTEYHRNYARSKLIYNKFTDRHERYTGEKCPDGYVRHHEYYNLFDINDGVIFMTQSDHMKLHMAIRLGNQTPIPIYCDWRAHGLRL